MFRDYNLLLLLLCHGIVVFFATIATGILAGTRDWEFKYCSVTVFVIGTATREPEYEVNTAAVFT